LESKKRLGEQNFKHFQQPLATRPTLTLCSIMLLAREALPKLKAALWPTESLQAQMAPTNNHLLMEKNQHM